MLPPAALASLRSAALGFSTSHNSANIMSERLIRLDFSASYSSFEDPPEAPRNQALESTPTY
jgi:hypothetical protein